MTDEQHKAIFCLNYVRAISGSLDWIRRESDKALWNMAKRGDEIVSMSNLNILCVLLLVPFYTFVLIEVLMFSLALLVVFMVIYTLPVHIEVAYWIWHRPRCNSDHTKLGDK